MRIDRDCDDHIDSFELLEFLRDNREYAITDRECKDLIKYFDADKDYMLSH